MASVYLLSGMGFGGLAVSLPSLWLSFSGYGFTLISAGHRGVFYLLPLAVTVLALVHRAIVFGRGWYFAAAAVVAAWGMAAQPDIMGLFALTGACYGIFLLSALWPAAQPLRFIRVRVGGALLAAVVFAVLMWPIFIHAQKVILPQRESGMGEDLQSRWIFASNWSLPPEETVEFLAPCIYGSETGDPVRPYWGRLGRSYEWERTGNGFRNFRQHTVYIGAIPIMFSLLGILAGLRRQRQTAGALASVGTDGKHQALFWLGLALAALLLAFGRYFPLFRAFHALPYFGRIRCPVKFMHIVDVSVAVLFAYGLDAYLRFGARTRPGRGEDSGPGPEGRGRTWRGPLGYAFLVSGTLSIAAVIAYAALPSFSGLLRAHWRAIGIDGDANVLLLNTRRAVAHAASCLVFSTGLFAMVMWRPRGWRRLRCALLTMVLLVDIVVVCRPFLRTRNMDPYYRPNALAQTVAASPDRPRLSYRVGRMQYGDPLWLNFVVHGVDIMEPRLGSYLDPELASYFSTLSANPLRLWQLTSCGYIFGPTKSLAPLISNSLFSVASYADLGPTGFAASDQPSAFALLAYRAALPRVGLFYRWRTVPAESMPAALADPSWKPAEEVLVTGMSEDHPSALASGPAIISQYRSNRITVVAEAKDEALLLVNDRYDPVWSAKVNGRRVELLKCNAVMRGVRVPPGRNEIVLTYHPNRLGMAVSVTIPALIIAWAWMGRRRSRGVAAETAGVEELC